MVRLHSQSALLLFSLLLLVLAAPSVSFALPSVSIGSPNGTNIASGVWVPFYFTPVSTSNVTLNCTLYVDGGAQNNNPSAANATLAILYAPPSGHFSAGNHVWYVNCTDSQGEGASGIGTFHVNGCVGATANFTCGDTITQSCTMDGTVSVDNADCFTIGAGNIVVDGSGSVYSILGNNAVGTNAINNTGFTNVTVQNFNIEGFGNGVLFSNATFGTIFDNSFSNNDLNDILLDAVGGSHNAVIAGNTFTGPATGYGIMAFSSNNLIIENNTGSGTSGIVLLTSDNSTINFNNASFGVLGIQLTAVTNSTVIGNVLDGNSNYGLILSSASNYNWIMSNNASGNLDSGIFVWNSNNNSLYNNLASGGMRGIYLANSKGNIVAISSATGASQYGFAFISGSDSNYIADITTSSNTGSGMVIQDSSYNFVNNTVGAYNGGNGLEVLGTSYYNVVTGNYFDLNNGAGIYVDTGSLSTYNNFTINDALFNNDSGIFLNNTDANLFMWNNCSSNSAISYGGIYLLNSDSNTLDNNYVESNFFMGIGLSASNWNVVKNNAIDNNYRGVYLQYAQQNNITDNIILNNSMEGILGSWPTTNGNYIARNAVLYGQYGIRMTNTSTNTLEGNVVVNNTIIGIYLENANATSMASDYFQGNAVDFSLYASSPSLLSTTGDVFDSPLAGLFDYVNYTNLSLLTNVNTTGGFNISWSAEPAAPAVGSRSVNQKYVLVQLEPGTSIDNLAFHWNASELVASSYDENMFGVMRYAGSWTVVPSIRDTVNKLADAVAVNTPGAYGLMEINDTEAPVVVLNGPGNGTFTNVSNVTLNFTATDNLASFPMCNITLDGVDTGSTYMTINNTPTEVVVSLPDGYHSWFVNCTDGTNSNVSQTWGFTVDTVPPVITLNYPANGYMNNTGTTLLNFSVSDNLAANLSCSFIIDTGIFPTNVSNGTSTEMGISLSEGNHTWSANCSDGANVATGGVRNFTIDLTAPVTTALGNGGSYAFGTWSNISVTVTLNCTDINGTGCANITYCTDASNTCVPSLNYGGGVLIGEGTLYIRFYSTDVVGNNESVQNRSVKTDLTAPVITLVLPLNGSASNNPLVDFNSTYVELNFDTAKLIINTSGGSASFYGYSCAGGVCTYMVNFSLSLGDGAFTWYVWMNDSAGNQNVSGIFSFIFDSVAPITSAVAFKADATPYANNTWTNQSVTLNLSCNDATSGCNQTLYCITYDGSACTPTTPWAMNSSNNMTFSVDNTTYYIHYRSQDVAGNYELPQLFVISIDTTGPVVNVQSPQSAFYNASSVPLAYTTYDASSGVASCSYVLDGAAPVALPGCANTTLNGLAYGVHNVTVISTDVAGNSGNDSVSFTVLICPGTVSSNFVLLGNIVNGSTASACIGVGANNIVIDCAGYLLNGTGVGYGVGNNGFDNVTVFNCTIVHFDEGIAYYNGANNGSIRANTLLDNVFYGVRLVSSNSNALFGNNENNSWIGYAVENSNYTNITNSNSQNNPGYGYVIIGSTNTMLTGVASVYNARHGLYLDSSPYTTMMNVSGGMNGWDGFNVDNSDYFTLTGLSYANNNGGNGITVLNSDYPNIFGQVDVTYQSSGYGIDFQNVNYGTINAIEVSYSNMDGIRLISSNYNNITNVHVLLNNRSGVWMGSSSNNYLAGNNITDNGLGSYGGVYMTGGSNNTLFNNSAAYSGFVGYYLSSTTGNYLINNFAHNNGRGIYLQDSGSNLLADNVVTMSTGVDDGIMLHYSGASNNVLVRNNISGSIGYGISIYDGANNLFINNTNELGVLADGSTTKFYSNVSQNISSSGNRGWWPLLRADGSTANVQPNTAWYNGTPSGGRNADGSANPNLAYWYNNLPLGCVGATKTFKCGDTITESCTMNWDDLNWATTCFTVGAHNILVDCAGHTITGTGSGSGIIDNGYQNVTVQNCVVGNFLDGFNFNSANGAALINDTAFNNTPFNSHGFVVSNTLYAFITQSTAYNINTYGFELVSTSNSSMVNNTAHNVLFGLYLGSGCQYNSISSNNAYDIGSQAYAMFGSSTRFNIFASNTARNITGGGVYGTHGFQFDNAPNNTVVGNNVSFSAGDGFNLDHANGNVLVGNMEQNSTYGIIMNSSNSSLVLGNTLSSNAVDGIYMVLSSNNIFPVNNVSDNGGAGFYGDYPAGNETTLVSNTFARNGAGGIYLYALHYSSLTANTVIDNPGSYGIYMVQSGNNNLTANNVSGNGGDGITLLFSASSGNNLLGNLVNFNAGNGVLLLGAPDNVLESNTAFNNTLGGIYLNKTPGNQSPDNAVLDSNIVTGNGDNGIYVANANNTNLTTNTAGHNGLGGITLETLTNGFAEGNMVDGNALSGIWVHNWPGADLESNIALDNGNDGIALYESGDASLIANIAVNNTDSGITLDLCPSSTLVNNTAIGNVGPDAPGIYLWNSTDCTLEGNNANANIHGIALWYSPTAVPINLNTANSNDQYGIGLYSSSATLTNNAANGNSLGNGTFLAGIGLFDSAGSTLTNNSANGNAQYGIGLAMSPSAALADNTANGNAYGNSTMLAGIGLAFSDNSTLTNNTANGNVQNGIGLVYSPSALLVNNTASGNGNGTVLAYSGLSTIAANTMDSNADNGLALLNSEGTNVSGNNASSNAYGFILDNSGNSTLLGNTLNDNSNTGAYLYYSDSGTIERNVVNGNGNRGIDLEYSNYNIVRNNSANDSGTCIYMTNTLNSTISYNNLTYCDGDGLDMYYTNYTSLSMNSYYGDEYGIYLDNSHFNTIFNETILESVDDSFDSGDSTNNLLQDVYMSSTSDSASDGTIYIYGGFENNTFNRITVNGTAWAGFYFTGASNNLVANCTMINNARLGAFYFDDAYNNTIQNCTVSGAGNYAFYFTGDAANNSIDNSTATAYNSSLNDVYAAGNSSNRFMNTTFNRTKATILQNGTIYVYWYARAQVLDNGGRPLHTTNVVFTDSHGTAVHNQTNFFEYSNYFEALEYSQNSSQAYPATVNSSNDYNATARVMTFTGSGIGTVDGTTTIVVHINTGGSGGGIGGGGGTPIGQNGQDYGPYGYSFQVCNNTIAGSYSYSTFVNTSESPKRTVVTIVLSNTGTAPTHAFLVRQPIPAGTVNMHNVSPAAVEVGADYIVWNITPISAGDTRTYTFTIWNLYAFDASYLVNYTTLTPIVDCAPIVINTTNQSNQTANVTLYADLQVLERVFVNDTVIVTVVGDDGKPIPGAIVSITGPDGIVKLTADSNGSVSFKPGVSGIFSYLVEGYVLRAPRATVVEPELPPVTRCTQNGDCGPGRICVSGVCAEKPTPLEPQPGNNCLPMVGFVALAGALGIGLLRGRNRLF